MTFRDTLGWLDRELAKLEEKAAKLRSARAVLAEFDEDAKKEAAEPPADRRAFLVARAAKVAAKQVPPTAATIRADGKPMPGLAGWTCRACGGRGHSARSRSCPKKAAAEPAPAPVLAAASAPLDATQTRGGAYKGKSVTERLCRCNVLVANEFGSGGRGIVKQQPCAATVWAGDRQKHLHAEHGIIDPAIEGYFEALKDPEEADVDAA